MDPLTMAAMGMGLFQMEQGIIQKKDAKAMAARNIFVPRKTAQGIKDNLDLAESRASQGLTDGAKTAYVQNADRGLSASIDAILRGGAGNNMLGELNDNYNQGLTRLGLAEDEARVRSLDNYMKASQINAQEDTTNWEVNDYGQWANKAQAAAQLSAQGTANISGGINTGISAYSSFMQGKVSPTAGLPGTSTVGTGINRVNPATVMIGNTPQSVRYTERSAINLNALGLRPLTLNNVNMTGPQLPDNWQTSERPYSNPYMWNGIN